MEHLKRRTLQYHLSFLQIQYQKRTEFLCAHVFISSDFQPNVEVFNKRTKSDSSLRFQQILLVSALLNQIGYSREQSFPADPTSAQQIREVEGGEGCEKVAERVEKIQ